ncbi:MAG: hypothetical protein LBU60_02590 [Clostridiales bacterium]|jgi:hypothetical protein|nr:hypothetical protein [Clostridiales bacterium]
MSATILDMHFYASNKVELERLREQHNKNSSAIVSCLEKAIILAFEEDKGWVLTSRDSYYQIDKSSWYTKKGAICYEIGMFDCGGKFGLYGDSTKLTITAYIAAIPSCKLTKQFDFMHKSSQSIKELVNSLKQLDENLTQKIDSRMSSV